MSANETDVSHTTLESKSDSDQKDQLSQGNYLTVNVSTMEQSTPTSSTDQVSPITILPSTMASFGGGVDDVISHLKKKFNYAYDDNLDQMKCLPRDLGIVEQLFKDCSPVRLTGCWTSVSS